MKKTRMLCCSVLIVSMLLPSVLSTASFEDIQDDASIEETQDTASFEDFPDAVGHPAEAVLRQAYEEGLIDGADGHLFPDSYITTAQVLALLCRILGADEAADISNMGLSPNKWYYDYVARAAYLGLISSVSATVLDSPISRQNAFSLMAEAFQIVDPNIETSILEEFSDAGQILDENRQALASLVSQGLISGYGGKLDVNANVTRATFLSVFYRIVRRILPEPVDDGSYEYPVLFRDSVSLSGSNFAKGIWLGCAASDIDISDVDAESLVIRSNALESLDISGATHIGRLTMAAQSGDIAVAPAGDAVVETLVIGSGGGLVSAKGIGRVEVAGNGRHVTITDSVDSVTVSGRNNTINVEDGAKVGKIELLASAFGSRVVAAGTISELEIISIGSEVSGSGSVETLRLYRPDTRVRVAVSSVKEDIDLGLTGASIKLKAPTTLAAGKTLSATATVQNAVPGIVCGLTWYIDNVPVKAAKVTTGDTLPALAYDFKYKRIMQESAEIKVAITYVTALGELQEISAESTVIVKNYNKQYWMKNESARVLKKVTLGYKGDYTLEWAQQNDLDDFDKEVWVYAKGFKSATDYLLWINLAYQRVNIFKRSGTSWELVRTCIVGTGRDGHGTPPGVWTTSYKEPDGWTTSSYTVKPVVRFKGGVGYAFHSRLYRPGTTKILDASIGFPISSGCIRMYDDDIKFIFDNIPDGTTVVVH